MPNSNFAVRSLDRMAGELNALTRLLQPEEFPEALAPGLFSGSGNWGRVNALLVATDRRVIFIEVGLARQQVSEVPFSDLVTVGFRKGISAGEIWFKSHGRDYSMPTCEGIPNVWLDIFVNTCQTNIQNAKLVESKGTETSVVNITDELERLDALREKGVLSDSEFQAFKDRLLNG